MSVPLSALDQPGQVSESLAPPTKKRRRPALACRQCRKRKIRCDQNIPCNNCTKSRIPDCSYPPTHVPGSAPSPEHGETAAPRRQLLPLVPRVTEPVAEQQAREDGRRPYFETGHPDPGFGGFARSSSSITASPNTATSYTSPQSRVDASTVDVLLAKISNLEKTISAISRSSNNTPPIRAATASKPSSPAPDDRSGLRFGNQSNWLNNTSLYTKILRVLGQARAEPSPLSSSLNRCRGLGGQIEKQLSVSTVPSALGTRLPERPIADELLNNYFSYFGGPLTVLHASSFRAEYDKFWQLPRDTSAAATTDAAANTVANDIFMLQLQVCLALGATAHKKPLRWRIAASQWLLEAQTWLSSSANKASKRPPCLKELQLACLLLIAKANTSGNDYVHQCWVGAGDLVRRAMWAGLHREPGGDNPESALKAEVRRRLWATILELNLLLSLQAGRPPLISTSDYDARPPLEVWDEELINDQPLSERSHLSAGEDSARADMVVQKAFFESFKLRLDIVGKVNNTGQDMSYDELLRLHSELSKAKKIMEQTISSCYLTPGSTTSHASSIAEILFSRYFLALHLPVLGLAIKNPAFHFSRRFCLTTAIHLAQTSGILDRVHSPGGTEEQEHASATGLRVVFVNSPGIFRHIAIQAIFAMALELVTFREEERENDGAVFPVCDVIELIRHLHSTREWAADQMRAGLADFKSYCFLGACLAYAAALESGAESSGLEQVIVEAAQEGAAMCWELLVSVSVDTAASNVAADAPTSMPAADSTAGALDTTVVSQDWAVSFAGGELDGFGLDWTSFMDGNWDHQLLPGTIQ